MRSGLAVGILLAGVCLGLTLSLLIAPSSCGGLTVLPKTTERVR